jgi:hypothetical protein
MSSDVNTGASALPDDFAAYQAVRMGTAKPEETSDTSDEQSEVVTAPDSETEDDVEQVEAEADDAEGEEDEEGELPKPKKGKGGFQKKIDKLTARQRELEQENEKLRQLAEKPAAKAEETPADSLVKRDEKTGEPVFPLLGEFSTFEEHEKALKVYHKQLADWTYEQRRKAETAQEKQSQAEKVWSDREASTRKTHPDYDEKLQELKIPNTPAVAAMRSAIGESDAGPELLYHLACNPEEAKRIVNLSPLRAVAELGKLEAKLTASKEAPKQKTKVSSAPDPITPVGGRARATAKPLVEVDDFSEYERRRKAGEKR